MPEIIQQPLSDNEVKFCEYWEQNVLPRKDKISSDQLTKAGGFIGVKRSGNCAQCLRNDAIELNNRFQRLYSKYQEYQSWKKSQDLVNKQTVQSIKEETEKIPELKEKREQIEQELEKPKRRYRKPGRPKKKK